MGKSKYNPIYEFNYKINNQNTTYRVTSVLGHLMGVEFPSTCKDWQSTNPVDLYHIDVLREPIEDSKPVV
jgi:DNA topoisomerase-3